MTTKKYKRLVANNLLYTVCMKKVDHLKFKLTANWWINLTALSASRELIIRKNTGSFTHGNCMM